MKCNDENQNAITSLSMKTIPDEYKEDGKSTNVRTRNGYRNRNKTESSNNNRNNSKEVICNRNRSEKGNINRKNAGEASSSRNSTEESTDNINNTREVSINGNNAKEASNNDIHKNGENRNRNGEIHIRNSYKTDEAQDTKPGKEDDSWGTKAETKEDFKWEDSVESVMHSTKNLVSDDDSDKPKMSKQVIGAFVVSLTQMGIGTIYGFSGVVLPQMTQEDSTDIYLSPNYAALFGSIISIGATIGGIIFGPLIARLGLKKSLLLTIPITLAIWLMLAFSTNVTLILSARIGLGMMVAAVSTPSNAYILEISHKDSRGILFAALPIARQFGFLFVYSLGSTSLSWRYMAIICGIVTTALPFLGLIFFPESPRWLVTRGREEEAEKSLLFFRGEKYDYKSELRAIVNQVNEDQKKNTCEQCTLLFTGPILKMFLKLFFITMIVSFNGSFAISTYLVPLFQSASSDVDPYTSAILVGIIRIIGTLCYTFLIDRLGRRPLHIFSYIIMCLTHVVLGWYFFMQSTEWVAGNLGWLPLTTVLIYTFVLGIGQPVLFMTHGELLPTSVRSLGLSLLTSVLFLGGFVVTQLFPTFTDIFGLYGNFWMYSIGCLVMVVFSYFALPETRKISLEDINGKK